MNYFEMNLKLKVFCAHEWRRQDLWSLRPLRYPSKWILMSSFEASCLFMNWARLWAAWRDPSEKCPSLLNRHADWALMEHTDIILRYCCRISDSLSHIWLPPDLLRFWTLSSANLIKSFWRSWEQSPNCPMTRVSRSPKLFNFSSTGPDWLGSVPCTVDRGGEPCPYTPLVTCWP